MQCILTEKLNCYRDPLASKALRARRVNRVSLALRDSLVPRATLASQVRRDRWDPRETEERWVCQVSLASTVFLVSRDPLDLLVSLVLMAAMELT